MKLLIVGVLTQEQLPDVLFELRWSVTTHGVACVLLVSQLLLQRPRLLLDRLWSVRRTIFGEWHSVLALFE